MPAGADGGGGVEGRLPSRPRQVLLMPDRSHGPMKFEAFEFLKLIVPHPPSLQRISSYSAGEFSTYKTPQTCFCLCSCLKAL